MKSVQSRMVKRILSIVLSLVFIFGTSTMAFAEDTSALKAKKEKIQQQINDAQSKIDSLASEKKKTQEYIAALDSKIQLLQDEIDVVQADVNEIQSNINKVEEKIRQTEDDIKSLQKQIDKKQKEFDKTFDEYCQRLRAIYISGNATNLEVLLTSTDISSILTRSQMIKSVSQKDSSTLDKLMTKMEEIEKGKADLEKKNIELNESKDKLVEERAVLQSNLDKINASKSELDSKVSEANALIRKLNSETAEYQEAIESDRSKVAEVERQIQAAYAAASRAQTGSMGGSSGDGSHSGALGYPTGYRSISAGYPNYSSGRYHGGVDFPCPSGTAVYAAAGGTVIAALNLNYSYGHYIIIDHGNGLSTLYAHNTTLMVSVGEQVSKGQQIAASGSTGNSTGPHCHFEVRVNGSRVNPMNYL